MWEMQGELGTSHAYEMGGDYRPVRPTTVMGILAADFELRPEDQIAWRIARIVQGDAWDEDASSPLARAGLNVRAGDRLLAINGQRLAERFFARAGCWSTRPTRRCYLAHRRGDEGEPRSRVTVKTLGCEARRALP